jgi:hypothetical protein
MKMTKISGVSERDIDLLLLEEFMSSKNFQDLFLKRSKFQSLQSSFLEARRSVTDSTGESDLEVCFTTNDDQIFMLMIENKVNASFQKDQLERYKQRGNNYIENNQIIDFETVLVAPKSFHNDDTKGFDFRINYEDMVKYYEKGSDLGARRDYKILLLNSAIEKGTSGYQMVADASVSNFWRDYWQFALSEARELYMDEPTLKPSTSSFIYFKNVLLPKEVDLVHKITHGYFDLQFKGMGDQLNIMRDRYVDVLENNMKIVKAGKSASIRIEVPKLSMADSLESQKEKVVDCLQEGKRLLKWFEMISGKDFLQNLN